MADSKISALTDGGNLQANDELAISRSATSFRAVALMDGWVDDTAETWTYATGSGGGTATFTIAGVDLTAKYTVGTRIKLTQTTVKYFTVIAVSFSTNTTVTITAGSDYTLANAAISANFHSYAANPQGYPGWFNFAASTTGWAATPTVVARFAILGRVCTIFYRGTGTSNSTSCGCTLPVTVSANETFATGVGSGSDNGAATAATSVLLTASSATAAFRLGYASSTSWTATGSKTMQVTFSYEI